MAAESREVVIAETDSLERANGLRSALLKEFSHAWLLVFSDPENGKCSVAAMNEWCGMLPQDKLESMIEFSKQFFDDNPAVELGSEECVNLVQEASGSIEQRPAPAVV